MIPEFYVDIDALDAYAKYLNKSIDDMNNGLVKLNKANLKYQATLQDDISKGVALKIQHLKKILNNFSTELNKLTKKIKSDNAVYSAYLKELK